VIGDCEGVLIDPSEFSTRQRCAEFFRRLDALAVGDQAAQRASQILPTGSEDTSFYG
jgi:hypothetical protein